MAENPAPGAGQKLGLTLDSVLRHIACHYHLDPAELAEVALSTPVDRGAHPSVKVNWVPVGDVLQSPPADMSVSQLKAVLEEHGNSEEKCLPFLLRFVLGEFHYGQRVTRLQPKQRPAGDAGASSSGAGAPDPARPPPRKKARAAEEPEHQSQEDAVFEVFNVLAAESRFRHLHQVAGWADMQDKRVWDHYVSDVCNHKVRPGDRVYEGGCGVLAFLKSLREQVPEIEIGGLDGAARTIRIVQDSLENERERDNFSVGLLPDGMGGLADGSWDVVLCNSVFQYIPDYEGARQTVEEFIRVSRKWVIVADVCDVRFKDKTIERVSANRESVYQNKLPDFLFFEKSWWDQFSDRALVSIRHVEVPEYERRRERYCVYLEKL